MQTEADGNLRVKVCSFNYTGNENVLSRVEIHRYQPSYAFSYKVAPTKSFYHNKT